jgi:hypothetical protein
LASSCRGARLSRQSCDHYCLCVSTAPPCPGRTQGYSNSSPHANLPIHPTMISCFFLFSTPHCCARAVWGAGLESGSHPTLILRVHINSHIPFLGRCVRNQLWCVHCADCGHLPSVRSACRRDTMPGARWPQIPCLRPWACAEGCICV